MTPTPGRIALTDPDLEDPRWPWAEMRADGLETTLFLKTSDLAALLNSVNQAWLPLGPPFSVGLGKLVTSHHGCLASGFHGPFLCSYPHPPVTCGRCRGPQQLRGGGEQPHPEALLSMMLSGCRVPRILHSVPVTQRAEATWDLRPQSWTWFGAKLFPWA